MKIGVAEIRSRLADAINRVAYRGERVILERRGKDVAALVSIEDLKRLEELEDREDLKQAKCARRQKGEVTLDDLKAEVGL